MMSIGVSSIGSVAISVGVASITISQPGVSLSLGLGLSLSRPLSVVETMTSIGVPVSIGSVASVSVGVSVAIGQPGVSLSLRLGLWLTSDQGGKANHKSELHCCLSVQFRMIPSSWRAQFIHPECPAVRATSRLLAFRSPPVAWETWRRRLQETLASRPITPH